MRLWLIGARIAVLTLCAPAAAQSDAVRPEPAEYQTVIKQAVEEYGARNFAEARAAFLRAHELYPNARTLRGIGMAEFELKNYGDCILRLEQALASRVKPLDGELRAQTETSLARARSYVGRFELELRPQVRGARIAIDGVQLKLVAGQALILTVGEHTLRAQAPGYDDEQRALSVKGGETQRLVIELRSTVTSSAPTLATSEAPAKQRDSVWSSPWLWTGVGAVVVGGVVTAVVLAGQEEDTAQPIAGDIGGVVSTLGSK